jgi:hypothetical protein
MELIVRAGAPWPIGGHRTWKAPRASVVLGALALLLAIAYAVAIVATGGEVLLLAPLVGAIVVLAVLTHPTIGLYVLFAVAMLFEQMWITGLSPITQTRIFQNLSTYTPIPLRFSITDLLLLLTIASLVVRRFTGAREPLRTGAFGLPVAAYATVFFIGAVIGIARGGEFDLEVAMNEIRGPLTLLAVYLLATNLIREERQLAVLMWLFVALVGIKALQGILNYRDAQELPYFLDAVTSKEDVVFFAAAVALGLAALVLGLRSKLAYVLLALQPVLLTAELVSNRRAGFVALGVTLLVMVLLTLVTHPRRGIVLVGAGVFALVAYVAAFWDATGPIAEPIRTLRSVLDPSATSMFDQSSDAWRAIENKNIAHTVRQLPLTGVGLGQQYLFQQEPSPLYGFLNWRYIAHNAVLWLWLKAGPLGALALWFLVARILVVGSGLYVKVSDDKLRLAVALPITLMVAQIVFSSVDLGLTFTRTMIVLGCALGMASFLAQRYAPQRNAADPS